MLKSFITLAVLAVMPNIAAAQMSLVHVTSCGSKTLPSACTIPATGTGNLIIVGVQMGGVDTSTTIASITDNAGNSYSESSAARSIYTVGQPVADIWYAKNSTAAATTITITPSATISGVSAVIWEVSGTDITTPIDPVSVLNSQGWSPTTAGAFARQSSPTGTYASSTASFNQSSRAVVPHAVVGSAGACDLNADGAVNVIDVQLAANMSLGQSSCTANIDGTSPNNACNSWVWSQVTNAALGGACVTQASHTVTLNWSASTTTSPVVTYNVYRSSAAAQPYTLKLTSTPISGLTYTDINVVAGQTYYYAVTAINSNGESGQSTPVQVPISIP